MMNIEINLLALYSKLCFYDEYQEYYIKQEIFLNNKFDDVLIIDGIFGK